MEPFHVPVAPSVIWSLLVSLSSAQSGNLQCSHQLANRCKDAGQPKHCHHPVWEQEGPGCWPRGHFLGGVAFCAGERWDYVITWTCTVLCISKVQYLIVFMHVSICYNGLEGKENANSFFLSSAWSSTCYLHTLLQDIISLKGFIGSDIFYRPLIDECIRYVC